MNAHPFERHSRAGLLISGGKDSLACAYLLRPLKNRLVAFHMDTGDLLPEQMAIVEHVKGIYPHFVHIKGDVAGWHAEHGMPTDLYPHSAHWMGHVMGQSETRLVTRFDCCFANLMRPCFDRAKADGMTLIIRGIKRTDMKKLPATSGDSYAGVEFYHPIEDWTDDDVFDYLRSVGAPISRVYEHMKHSPECARCPAWWDEKRAAYLKQFHPELFADYADRMRVIAREIAEPLANFQREMEVING